MNKLSEQQIDLLNKVMSGTLPYQSFLNTIKFKIDIDFCFNLILESKVKNDASKFRNVLWGLVPQLAYNQRLLIYRMALIDQWHHEHEEVINAFQVTYNTEPENIEYIIMAMQNLPNYLSNAVLKDSYIRKCFYAISAQSSPDKEIALKKLTANQDHIIANYATYQLQKLQGDSTIT